MRLSKLFRICCLLLSVSILCSTLRVRAEMDIYDNTRGDFCNYLDYNVSIPGSFGAYNLSDGVLKIFPNYCLDKHITVVQLVNSSMPYVEAICAIEDVAPTVKRYDGFTIFEYAGRSYGFKRVDDIYTLVAYTSDLPTSYVKVVLQNIWK